MLNILLHYCFCVNSQTSYGREQNVQNRDTAPLESTETETPEREAAGTEPDPSLTTSRTLSAVLQTTPINQPQYISDNPELESGTHVVDYPTIVPIEHDSYTGYYTTLPPQTMENTVDFSPSPTKNNPPPYNALFKS